MEFEVSCLFFRVEIDDVIGFDDFVVWMKLHTDIEGGCFYQLSYVWKLYISESTKWNDQVKRDMFFYIRVGFSLMCMMSDYVDFRKICAAIIDSNYKFDELFTYKFLMTKDIEMIKIAVKKWPEIKNDCWVNALVNYGDIEDFQNVMKVFNITLCQMMDMLRAEITPLKYRPYVAKVEKIIGELMGLTGWICVT